MTDEITLRGFVQGRVDIVVEQSYGKQYKASGWINLEPVLSYQRPIDVLKAVTNLNKEKFQQFKFVITQGTYDTIKNGEEE